MQARAVFSDSPGSPPVFSPFALLIPRRHTLFARWARLSSTLALTELTPRECSPLPVPNASIGLMIDGVFAPHFSHEFVSSDHLSRISPKLMKVGVYSLNARTPADNFLGSRHKRSIWRQPFWRHHPSWPESNRLQQNVSMERSHLPCLH